MYVVSSRQKQAVSCSCYMEYTVITVYISWRVSFWGRRGGAVALQGLCYQEVMMGKCLQETSTTAHVYCQILYCMQFSAFCSKCYNVVHCNGSRKLWICVYSCSIISISTMTCYWLTWSYVLNNEFIVTCIEPCCYCAVCLSDTSWTVTLASAATVVFCFVIAMSILQFELQYGHTHCPYVAISSQWDLCSIMEA